MHLDAANGRWSAGTTASPPQSDSLERTSCLFDLPRPPFGHIDARDADSDTGASQIVGQLHLELEVYFRKRAEQCLVNRPAGPHQIGCGITDKAQPD